MENKPERLEKPVGQIYGYRNKTNYIKPLFCENGLYLLSKFGLFYLNLA